MTKFKGKTKLVSATLERVKRAGVFVLEDRPGYSEKLSVYQNASLGVTVNECDVQYLIDIIKYVKILVIEFETKSFDQWMIDNKFSCENSEDIDDAKDEWKSACIVQLPVKYSQIERTLEESHEQEYEFEIHLDEYACLIFPKPISAENIELQRYERVNKCETIDELCDVLKSFADDSGHIQGRYKTFEADNMIAWARAFYNGETIFANRVTREYGLRQQLLYLCHYKPR